MRDFREYFSKGGREERGEWMGELRREKGVGDAEIGRRKCVAATALRMKRLLKSARRIRSKST